MESWLLGAGFFPIAIINLLSLKRRRDSDFKNNLIIMKRQSNTHLKIFLAKLFLRRYLQCLGLPVLGTIICRQIAQLVLKYRYLVYHEHYQIDSLVYQYYLIDRQLDLPVQLDRQLGLPVFKDRQLSLPVQLLKG